MNNTSAVAPGYFIVPATITDSQFNLFAHAGNEAVGNGESNVQAFRAAIATIAASVQSCTEVETVCWIAPDYIARSRDLRADPSAVYVAAGATAVALSLDDVPLVRLTDMEVQVAKAREDAMRQGYLLGFNSSGEGWNGEYPFKDKAQSPDEDAGWLRERDGIIREVLHAGEGA